MIRTKRTERGEIMAGNVIEIKNLEKQYMKNKVIKDVSFEIKEGSIVGLIVPGACHSGRQRLYGKGCLCHGFYYGACGTLR